jgi:hypothetical protein
MPIDGRASVLGMGFGVRDLLLRYVTYLESSSTAWITVVANVYTTEV